MKRMVQFNETGKTITKWRFVGQLYDVRLPVRWLSTCMILPTCMMSFLCDVFVFVCCLYICMRFAYLYDVCHICMMSTVLYEVCLLSLLFFFLFFLYDVCSTAWYPPTCMKSAQQYVACVSLWRFLTFIMFFLPVWCLPTSMMSVQLCDVC
jgi:hypothetical protein